MDWWLGRGGGYEKSYHDEDRATQDSAFSFFEANDSERGSGFEAASMHSLGGRNSAADEIPQEAPSEIEDFEENTYSSSGWFELCCTNTFAPCYAWCMCFYHVGRSVPSNTLLWTVAVITGWVIFRTNVSAVESDLHNTGLSIDWFLFPIDFMCASIFILDFSIVVSSALLTGWTLEAMCAAFDTGTFETHGNGREVRCHCWLSGYLKRAWWCSLHVIAALAYVAGALVICILLATTCGWFVVFCLVEACGQGSMATEDFMDVVTARFSDQNIGTISYADYCDSDSDKKNDVSSAFSLMFVGMCIVLGGQLALFGTMTDNLRIAKSERLRHLESSAGYQPLDDPDGRRRQTNPSDTGRLAPDTTF